MAMDYRWEPVDFLESREEYEAALALMVSEWKKEPENLKVVIRLGFLCWYVTVEAGVLGENGLDAHGIADCEKLFSELVVYGQEKFSTHPDFLWTYGYMISLFPDYFDLTLLTASEEYGNDVDELGEKMIGKAQVLRPKDQIIELIFNYNEPKLAITDKYKKLCAEVSLQLPSKFQGQGEMQRYFREVLNRTGKQL